jgi:hypothetical protein
MLKLATLCCLCAVSSYANWGGDGGGSVGTGAFRAFGTAQVEMQREDLQIQLFRDRAKVQVEYTVKNTGDGVNVKAGFPSLELIGPSGSYAEVANYHLTADGKEVPFKAEKGDLGNWKTLFDPEYVMMATDPGEDTRLCAKCGLWWLASTVHFDKDESKHIRITYESRYQFAEGGPSGDSYYKPDMFRYLLSPAATWKGPIQQGKIAISAVSVDPKVILIKPAARFKNTPAGYVWEFTNLKPTLADNLEISMNNSFKTMLVRGPESQETSWYSFEGSKYFFDFHDYQVRASSTAKGYDPNNIKDLQNETAWVAGANGGVNESLTLTLDKPTHVDQLGLVPGYGKNESLYFANNRVQEVAISVNNGPATSATLPDEFVAFSPGSYKGYALVNLGGYSGDARTVTLTIRKVYKGSKYNDLCISEILLRKRLPREPQVHGAR